jgi:hypothetical protein
MRTSLGPVGRFRSLHTAGADFPPRPLIFFFVEMPQAAHGSGEGFLGADPSVWPKLAPPAQEVHPVNSAALADSLLSVLPATGTGETRGHLMTVHVESDGADRTVFVTTDGSNLARYVETCVLLQAGARRWPWRDDPTCRGADGVRPHV